MTTIVVLLSFPLKAKAEWYVIGHSDSGPIYLNDNSVYIQNELRTAEVRYVGFGRAVFVVNCDTNYYYIQSNEGRGKDYAAPGTVAGIVAEEVCDRYHRR